MPRRCLGEKFALEAALVGVLQQFDEAERRLSLDTITGSTAGETIEQVSMDVCSYKECSSSARDSAG